MLAKHALSQLSYGPAARNASQSENTAKAGLREPKLARRIRPPSPFGFGAAASGSLRERRLVGLGRLELPTSRLSSARSNQLSYKPLTLFLKKETGTCARATGSRRCIAQAQPQARVRPRRKRNEDGEIPPMELNDLAIAGP